MYSRLKITSTILLIKFSINTNFCFTSSFRYHSVLNWISILFKLTSEDLARIATTGENGSNRTSGNERFRNQFCRYSLADGPCTEGWNWHFPRPGRGPIPEHILPAMNNGGCLSKFLKCTTGRLLVVSRGYNVYTLCLQSFGVEKLWRLSGPRLRDAFASRWVLSLPCLLTWARKVRNSSSCNSIRDVIFMQDVRQLSYWLW